MNILGKFAREIYNETIDSVLEGIEPEEQEKVSQLYYQYLLKRYSTMKFDEYEYEEKIDRYLPSEKRAWEKRDPQDKKQILLENVIEDKALKEIFKLQFEATKAVANKDRRHRDLSVEEADEYIRKMTELLKEVKDFNMEEAIKVVEETKSNFLYASNRFDFPTFKIRGK